MTTEITTITRAPMSAVEGADHDGRLIELWLHGRSKATSRGYRAEAQRFLTHVCKPLRSVALSDLQDYADELERLGLQPATRRRMLAAVKSLYSFGRELGYLPYDTAKPLRLPSLRDTLAERIIHESLVLHMIALEPNPRNAAIIAVLYGGGLRVSELVGLKWKHIIARGNGGGQASVFGKGAKTRTILLAASVFRAICELRGDADEERHIFVSRKRGSLHPSQVLRITKAAAKRAGISRNVRNHDLRHCHASHSLERGAPIHLVQATLGHSSVATTGRYLHARPNDGSARYLPL